MDIELFEMLLIALPLLLVAMQICATSLKTSFSHKRLHFNMQADPFEASWTRTSSSSTSSVGLAYFSKGAGQVRGLVSRALIAKQDILTRIKPIDSFHVLEFGDQCPIAGFEPSLWRKLSGNSRLSLILLLNWNEYSARVDLEEKGFLDSYLRSLPGPLEFDTPIHWNESFVNALPYDFIKRFHSLHSTQPSAA